MAVFVGLESQVRVTLGTRAVAERICSVDALLPSHQQRLQSRACDVALGKTARFHTLMSLANKVAKTTHPGASDHTNTHLEESFQ
jgi:hypothetical protein